MKINTIVDFGSDIKFIVITGGPCSGKTTGLSILKSKLTDRGYKVLVSPESATKLITAGVIPGVDELEGFEFQQEILNDTLEQEARIFSIAKRYRDKGKKVVVLCDRGTMDGQAYIDPNEFREMLRSFGYTKRLLCDERYHAVIHLRTAALGAEAYYTLANNSARTETPELARQLDERTFEAWQRHPHPRVIDNSTDFHKKIQRLFNEVCGVLGEPIPKELEEKYLIDVSLPIIIPVKTHESWISQDYLVSADPREESRIRARKDGDGTTYYLTYKRYVAPGNRVEIERMISFEEYSTLYANRDIRSETIIKKRSCFFWKERHFEVDFFEKPDKVRGLVLMESESLEHMLPAELPPFINLIRNVTNEKRYSNAEIARTVK